jgi:hypothetical protein
MFYGAFVFFLLLFKHTVAIKLCSVPITMILNMDRLVE